MRDVIKQVEAVIDDEEFPATLDELVVMERILLKISLFHTIDRETNMSGNDGAGLRKDRFFPHAVFDYLRQYEIRRKVHGRVLDSPVPVSAQSGTTGPADRISCPTS
jgi:hypothetical protein